MEHLDQNRMFRGKALTWRWRMASIMPMSNFLYFGDSETNVSVRLFLENDSIYMPFWKVFVDEDIASEKKHRLYTNAREEAVEIFQKVPLTTEDPDA